jgi:predicted nucleic acid-binding protein
VSFLVDTNVLSELRRAQPHPSLTEWFRVNRHAEIFVSALVMGEIRRGIEHVRGTEPRKVIELEEWLRRVRFEYADRILPVTADIAELWGRIHLPPNPLPIVDGLMAATALVHGLTFVTRNTRDVARCGVSLFNPFAD